MSILSVTQRGTTLTYDTDTLLLSVSRDGAVWRTTRAPFVQFNHPTGEARPYPWAPLPASVSETPLTEAKVIETKPWKTGLGEGFLTRFEGIPHTSLTLETLVWVDNCRGELFAELIPYEDPKDEWHTVIFPTAFSFSEPGAANYTVINYRQGLMLPNGHKLEEESRVKWGQYCSAAAYMPWFGQVRGKDAYIAIGVTPYDGGYLLDYKADDSCEIAQYWMPSLGRMGYRRVVRYTFIQGGYNELCEVYRQYARETGLLVTLKEKAVRNPSVGRLVGCAIVHQGIYENRQPDSHYYDHEHPENNTRLFATFDQRAAQLTALKEKWGLDKIYFHMDGWGIDGYDSHHPDYLPPNEKAGGWAGMKRLSDTLDRLGYLFATHDQYRDYHYNAESFDEEMAVHDTHGDITVHSYWLGGKQSYLCSSQAPGYVRRNYSALEEHGIHLKGTYQDVFTIVDLDECDHPWHRATRKQCAEYRKACFDYVMAHGIAISSEEIIDWAMQTLAYCHHAPQVPSMAPEFPRGIPLPLSNIVYHDCVIQPGHLGVGPSYNSDLAPGQNGLLLALLNGNAGYLPIEPTQEDVDKYKLVAALQEKTQYSRLLRHEYLSPYVQRTTFEGGVTVTIDTEKNTWDIQGM